MGPPCENRHSTQPFYVAWVSHPRNGQKLDSTPGALIVPRDATPAILHRVPPVSLVIAAVIGFQLGTVLSKPAVDASGTIHTSFIRIAIGAVLLLAWTRPRRSDIRANLLLICASGLAMLLITIFIYAAIQRIPIGIAIAIEFWGPMALALTGSRHRLDLIWIALAVGGILLFTPLSNARFDTLGILYAVAAGGVFAGALVFSSRLGHQVGGIAAAGLSMLVATIAIAPVSFATGLTGELTWSLLGRMTIVALLVNVVGFSMEYTALTRVKPSLYAILICLEPAAGTILAYLILDEHIGVAGYIGILAVTSASIGATRGSNRVVA